MLRITVELVPFGKEAEKRLLGTATIVNDGTGSILSGNYYADFSKSRRPTVHWKRVEVKDFPRERYNHWRLLYLALKAATEADKEKGGVQSTKRFRY